MGNDAATILVVDDEPGILRLLETILHAEGYDVIGTDDGHEALDLLRSRTVDLVILDLLMPDLSGWDFLHRLERLDNPPPVAVVSAIYRGEAVERARERFGAAAYLTKPFRVHDLLDTIHQILTSGAGGDTPPPA